MPIKGGGRKGVYYNMKSILFYLNRQTNFWQQRLVLARFCLGIYMITLDYAQKYANRTKFGGRGVLCAIFYVDIDTSCLDYRGRDRQTYLRGEGARRNGCVLWIIAEDGLGRWLNGSVLLFDHRICCNYSHMPIKGGGRKGVYYNMKSIYFYLNRQTNFWQQRLVLKRFCLRICMITLE